jgi:uncharacterized repeat protein (TIGR01451 family)
MMTLRSGARPSPRLSARAKWGRSSRSSRSNTVAVANTGGADGTLGWTLLGPLAPAADGTCSGLNWSNAPTADQGTIPVAGDGSYTTSTSAPTATGCYSYAEQLDGTAWLGPGTSAAGAAGEQVLVAQPSLQTSVSSALVPVGGTVIDAVDTGTTGQPGSIAWQLLGPMAPAPGGGCAGLEWSSAPTADHGTINVAGDGVYQTPASTLSAPGCYSYTATLTGAAYGGSVTSSAGAQGEVAEAPEAQVTIEKNVNHDRIQIGKSLTYTLTVANAGPDTATDVTVTDNPSVKMRLVSAKTDTGSCDNELPLTCQMDPLPPGGDETITVEAVPLEAGEVVDDAHVTIHETNSAPADKVFASASANVLVPLKLTKAASVGSVDAGGKLQYKIVVANPSDAEAKDVAVCDRLPAGLVFKSASVKTHLDKGIFCRTLGSIHARGRKTYTLTVRRCPAPPARRPTTPPSPGPRSTPPAPARRSACSPHRRFPPPSRAEPSART